MDRREMLRRFGLTLATVPLLQLACDGPAEDVDAAVGGGDGSASGGDGGIDAPTDGDGWASGGTAAMTDKASYPDPFTVAPSSCLLLSATTEGPCTTATDLDREDVSESWTGLPVRLAFKVVDSSCQPLAGVVVKIWHTNLAGVYSGQTPNPGMCSNNDASAIAASFFRGVRTTAADGTAYFDTCFPGWYRGRAVHIHAQVTSGSTAYRISQVFFPESVTAGIFASHPEYRGYGQPDTTFASDNVAAGISDMSRHTVTVARMSDGAMLASKVLTVTT